MDDKKLCNEEEIKIPYNSGKTHISLPPRDGIEVVDYKRMPVYSIDEKLSWQNALVKEVKGKRSVAILVDDHTRPTPIKDLLPHLFNVLEVAGVRERIIVVAFGTHNVPPEEYLIEKLGKEVWKEEKIILHDAFSGECEYIGTTSFGNRVYVNRWVKRASFRIGCGSIFASEIAGFTGGGKIVLPGVSCVETIEYNHAFFERPEIKAGYWEENPVARDIVEAARMLPLEWVIDMILTPDGVVDILYGDFEEAHRRGREMVLDIYGVRMEKKVKYAVAGCGMTEDVDFIQTTKALFFLNHVTREGAEILLFAACPLGINWEELIEAIETGKATERFACAVIHKLSSIFKGRKKIYIHSLPENREEFERMGFTWVDDPVDFYLSLPSPIYIFPNSALLIP